VEAMTSTKHWADYTVCTRSFCANTCILQYTHMVRYCRHMHLMVHLMYVPMMCIQPAAVTADNSLGNLPDIILPH
jgi:hypothetical protein